VGGFFSSLSLEREQMRTLAPPPRQLHCFRSKPKTPPPTIQADVAEWTNPGSYASISIGESHLVEECMPAWVTMQIVEQRVLFHLTQCRSMLLVRASLGNVEGVLVCVLLHNRLD
jgi:hypothetical protein